MDDQLSEIEQALRAIVPSAPASPAQLMYAAMLHAVAVGKTVHHRRRRRAVRRHGAHVRLRELVQSRQYNRQLDLMDLHRQVMEPTELREMLEARKLNRCDDAGGSIVRTAMVYFDIAVYKDSPTKAIDARAYLETSRYARASIALVVPAMCDSVDLPGASISCPCSSGTRDTLTLNVSRSPVSAPDHAVTRGIVRTTADSQFGLTLRTIAMIFPHAAAHDRLVQQLVGKSLDGEATYNFTCDRVSGRIVRLDPDYYFLVVFLRLVADPTELAFPPSQAKITEEMLIGEVEVFDADALESSEENIDTT